MGVPNLRPYGISITANIMNSCRVVIRAPKFASRSYSHAVLLVARGGDGRLARAPAVELRLDVGLDEG